jgi:Tfp pilus assembly protein PilW
MNKRLSGMTLIELVVAVILLSVIILAVMSIGSFGRYHLISSDRRARLQNELSFALEHMQKNIVQATGNATNPPIVVLANGFSVRVDRNLVPTLSIADDTTISYTLAGNTLTCSDEAVIISSHICSGVSTVSMPLFPASGFYINVTDRPIGVTDRGATVEVGLVGRWAPTIAESLDNPQVVMKTKVCASSASTK